MSQSAARKVSISENAQRGIAAKQNFALSWRSVKTYVETVMPFVAGVACVDLDSVLLKHNPEDGSRLGPALPLGVKLVNLLHQRGYQVVVLTARSKGHQKILRELCLNGVWVDRVTNRKPYADCYMDNKAIHIPRNWEGEGWQKFTNQVNAPRKHT